MDSIFSDITFYSYGLAAFITLIIGVVYASRKQVMPYHLQALESSWEDIDPRSQLMMRLFLNGGGYYGVSSALFMLVLLLIPYRDGASWAAYAIGIIGLFSALPLCLIVYQVKTKTKGEPPLWLMALLVALLTIGLVCSLI